MPFLRGAEIFQAKRRSSEVSTAVIFAKVNGAVIAAQSSGDVSKPALILLHGWPQSSRAFGNVLAELGVDNFVLAFDLPGIGASQGLPPSAEKTEIAGVLLKAAEQLGARDILVAGYDVGGMIAYAAARDHAKRIAGAMVMNTVLPGISPWENVLADPRIFHFALHAIPGLPEKLVAGRQRQYFDFFYNVMAGDESAIKKDAREEYAKAYERPDALKAGFDWYRAMANDARRNARRKGIEVPMMYVRGDADGQTPENYVQAIREKGAQNILAKVIPGGEYVAEEAPTQLIAAIREFRRACTK
jgi:pimeloyl-ACP methyl ester carboxylesterase